MPKLTVDGKTHEVESGKRLVLAIEATGVKIGHRCGGFARCTTCRVEFLEGEPITTTQAEHHRLVQRELLGQARLSCQIVCDHDMSVHPLLTADIMPQWNGDTGPTPEATVTPLAEWLPIDELKVEP